MGSKRLAFMLATCLLVLYAFDLSLAHGHNVGSSLRSFLMRIENEQFSDNAVTTNEVLTIKGEFVSLVDRELKFVPYIFVDSDAIPPYTNLLLGFYPPLKDQSTWYFRVEHNMQEQVILGPGEVLSYEIKLYPLKAGKYHVHTYVLTDYGARMTRGQTVVVDGQHTPTVGEISQLYLPLALGATTLVALAGLAIRRSHTQAVKEKAIRIFYTLKSSFETMWLSGILFWLVSALYLPVDGKYLLLIGVIIVSAAITFCGFVVVAAKSRSYQRLFAIGTSAATVALYFALGYSSIDIQFRQLNHDGLVGIIAIFGNIAAAIFISVLAIKERKRPAEIVH